MSMRLFKDKDKALILLSFSDEYGTFVLTIINVKSSLYYDVVLAALVNLELRKDQESFVSMSAEALTARGLGSNRGKGRLKFNLKFKFGSDLANNQCAFCKEIDYWKVDCLKLRWRQKERRSSKANVAQTNGDDSDSSGFSFLLLPQFVIQMLSSGFWILALLIIFILDENGFLVSRNYFIGKYEACCMLGIGTVRIKMFNGMFRELHDARYLFKVLFF